MVEATERRDQARKNKGREMNPDAVAPGDE